MKEDELAKRNARLGLTPVAPRLPPPQDSNRPAPSTRTSVTLSPSQTGVPHVQVDLGDGAQDAAMQFGASNEQEQQECERHEAEERGRRYEEAMGGSPVHQDDLGDLDEDVDDPPEQSSDSAPTRSSFQPPSPLHEQTTPLDVPLHDVLEADPRFPNENATDPYFVSSANTDTARITPLNTHPSIFQLYMLVAWLHTQCKLAFTACAAVLVVFGHILAAAGLAFGQDQRTPYVSLASVMNNTGIEPAFQILVVCPNCLEPYPSGRSSTSSCDRCASPLFRPAKGNTPVQESAGGGKPARPLLQAPHMSIEAQLRAILAMPGMEDHMESWRSTERVPGTRKDIFDGNVTKGLRGPDGKTFFENPLPKDCTELRVGVVAGLDW
jgi:hypothetical protein